MNNQVSLVATLAYNSTIATRLGCGVSIDLANYCCTLNPNCARLELEKMFL